MDVISHSGGVLLAPTQFLILSLLGLLSHCHRKSALVCDFYDANKVEVTTHYFSDNSIHILVPYYLKCVPYHLGTFLIGFWIREDHSSVLIGLILIILFSLALGFLVSLLTTHSLQPELSCHPTVCWCVMSIL